MNRRLTDEEALNGVRPQVLTKQEWNALYDASLIAEHSARSLTNTAMQGALMRSVGAFAVSRGLDSE